MTRIASAVAAVSLGAALATGAQAGGAVRVTVSSPSHSPKANVGWPVRVTVADASGKPLPATVTMRVLFAGQQVGKIDNGAVYRFVGTWQEKPGNQITWPAAARGQPLTLQFVVGCGGVTVRRNWAIRVR